MKRKNIILTNLVCMLIFVGATCYLTFYYLDVYTLHGKAITVPDIKGMQLEEATKVLKKNNLNLEVIDFKFKKGIKENEVLEQRPVSGARVKRDRKIMLTLSSSKEPTQTIPDIIDNCSLREAEARLQALGFKLNKPISIAGEQDWVYSLLSGGDTLKVGEQVVMGSTLTLVIGSRADSLRIEPVEEIDISWFE